ncbi:MAG TPA: phage major capsid protein [Ktedonobacterales bacterium]
MSESTLTARELHALINNAWNEFGHYSETAQHETKHDGAPSLESRFALAAINERLERLMAQLERVEAVTPGALQPVAATEAKGEVTLNGETFVYEKNTPEHRTFVRALRYGIENLPPAEHANIKMADSEDVQPALKAMSLANDTTGGYLASNEFASDVLREMQAISPVRQVVRVVPISGGTGLNQPIRTGIQTAVRVRETADRTANASDLAFKLAGVPVHEMMASTVISRALLADSKYPLDVELADAASRAFALLEGYEFIKGDGVDEMLGLDNASLSSDNVLACDDSSGHLVAPDDILKLAYETLPAQYLAGARLLLHPRVLGALRLAKATSDNTFLTGVADSPFTICGLPYTLLPDMESNETPAANKNVAYLLNPAGYTLTVRQELTVMRIDQLLAQSGQILFYIFQRTGGQVVLGDAIARLKTA